MKIPELAESGVRFDREHHRYFLGDKELKGITSTFVRRLDPHEYDSVDPEYLAKRAEYGQGIHDMIDFCIDNGVESEFVEWKLYKDLMKGRGLISLRGEYIVTDGERYASAIDRVYMKESDGTIVIVDFKTNYAPPLKKATAQLSWYKREFERMNPTLKVSETAVLWIRNDAKRGPLSGYFPVDPWSDEMLDALILCDIEDKDFAPIMQSLGDFPVKFAEVEDEVARLEQEVKTAKARQDELRKGLYDLMVECNIKSFTGSRVRLTRVLPTTSKSFDTNAFKKDYPETYDEYCVEKEKAGSLRITLL